MTTPIENQKSKIENPHPLPIFHTDFSGQSRAALHDESLQAALANAVSRKDQGRRDMLAELPDAQGLRQKAAAIKQHTLENFPRYLNELTASVTRNGGHVHLAATAADANRIIVEIARRTKSQRIVKSKSMVTEETRLNDALEAAGLTVTETDLGEFIIQLAHDRPSHIVMPVMHKRAPEIGRVFAEKLGVPYTADHQALAEIARQRLRDTFIRADMGITGANFAIAETGSIVLCTNEGNGRMCSSRPRVHVALISYEKIIPKLADLPVFLQLLARSASGVRLTIYTSLITGPKRPGERDGPEESHLVILDNGRSKILGTEFEDVLRCIRCGACLNACPVYRKAGGHAYGSVYPGPIGAVLSPLLNGLEQHPELPNATTLCGACYEACPVMIDLPEMLIQLQRRAVRSGLAPRGFRGLFRLWTLALRSRFTYALAQRLQRFFLRRGATPDGFVTRLPGPAAGWSQVKDLPAPAPQSFRQLWSSEISNLKSPSVSSCLRGENTPPSPAPSPNSVDQVEGGAIDAQDAKIKNVFITAAQRNGIQIAAIAASALPSTLDSILACYPIRRILLNAGAHDAAVAAHLAASQTFRWADPEAAQLALSADAAITTCYAAVADSGAILVVASPTFGRASTLTTPVHIVLLRPAQILPDLAALYAELQGDFPTQLPSNAVLIAGPSKTADIEMDLITGVHGPKHLHILLLQDP